MAEPLVIEAARLSRIQGYHRRLECLQNIKRYLHEQAFKLGKAEMELNEALNGPIVHWNIHTWRDLKSPDQYAMSCRNRVRVEQTH
jgi:hypothetical protein